MTTRSALGALCLGFLLAGCASAPEAAAPSQSAVAEQRLVRPPNQPPQDLTAPPATSGSVVALDAGEAALAESEAAVPPEDGAVVVPGQRETPVLPPGLEDPRSPAQRADDIRAWDRCVSRAQRRIEEPTSSAMPVSDTPEAQCAESLGMASRDAVPERRFRRR